MPALAVALLAGVLGARRCPAQRPAPPITVASNTDGASDVRADVPLEVTLSRPLTTADGELALVVGGLDVTAVSERSSSRIVYRPTAVAIPEGDTEIAVYRRSTRGWTELRRFTARVRQAVVDARPSFGGSASVGNTGRLAQGQSAGLPATDRRTFQDFVLNAGLRSSRAGGGWSLSSRSNYVGVTRREEALRFATQGARAPMLDLSDYVVEMHTSAVRASLGHVTFGESRHLASSLAARGATLAVERGSTTIRLGALNGTSQLGWSNFTGLERATDRVFGAALGREVVPSRPGALRLDLTLLDGSKLPATSFTQGAVVDAEKSAGGSLQMTAALPNQRLRLTAGYSRSRFENPANDPQLRGDSITRRPAPATRGARFVELSGTPLQNARLPGGPATITLGFRDERVDPLYGSVAASVAADRARDAVDATFSLGAITAQLTQSFGRDNLGRVESVLTTNDRTTTASLAMPMPAMAGRAPHGAWLPTLTFALNRTHQFAAEVPTNGQFRPSDLPDQMSTNADVAAAWRAGRYHLSLRANRSVQDNRQAERENADFDAGVRALSVGANLGTRGDVTLDLGDEHQTARERGETTRTQRLALNSSLTSRRNTGLVAAVSVVRTRPPAAVVATINTEERLELSQALRFWSGTSGEQRGQLFLRYARTTARLPDPALSTVAPLVRVLQHQWSLSSGFTMRIF